MRTLVIRNLGWLYSYQKSRFQKKTVTWDKEIHFIMTKGSIYQKAIILNICVPNNNPFKIK